MITLYTSVGRYELRKNENGEKQPIVTVDQKEMALSREELLLWSCLMWGILTKEEAKADTIFKKVLPEDLMKFGLIPEFAGRLPVVVTLDSLDKDALIKILQEPKNALIKQYQHFLAMDNVELEFEDGALVAIAEEALKRNAGARGLRSIIEEVMRNVMYEVPSRIDVVKCVVTEAAIREHMEPKMVVAS